MTSTSTAGAGSAGREGHLQLQGLRSGRAAEVHESAARRVYPPAALAPTAGTVCEDSALRAVGRPRAAATAPADPCEVGVAERTTLLVPRSLPRCPHCGRAALFLVRVVPPLRFKAEPAIADTS